MQLPIISISELPSAPAGPSRRRDQSSLQEQDEPPQPGHLLRPGPHARHQRPPRPGRGAIHCPTTANTQVSHRNMAQESRGPLTNQPSSRQINSSTSSLSS